MKTITISYPKDKIRKAWENTVITGYFEMEEAPDNKTLVTYENDKDIFNLGFTTGILLQKDLIAIEFTPQQLELLQFALGVSVANSPAFSGSDDDEELIRRHLELNHLIHEYSNIGYTDIIGGISKDYAWGDQDAK